MKKTIVIFSNPFGYGPTGKALAIAKEFAKNHRVNVIFAGNSFVREIVPSAFHFVEIDERDERAISDLLRTINDPFVVSSQNRFVIKSARLLGIPCAFLDGLSWFWDEIPQEHLLADEIFWMAYPGLEHKMVAAKRPINVVPAIIDVVSENFGRDQILIHLGGCKNPLVEIFPKNYLDILLDALSLVSSDNKIKITGGAEVVGYLTARLSSSKIKDKVLAVSLGHNEFIQELGRSVHFVTTAGQTATLEAFALGVPTSFLLPMNLSQLALVRLLLRNSVDCQYLSWKDYISDDLKVEHLKEKDAITIIDDHAKKIVSRDEEYQKLKNDIRKMVESVPAAASQKRFVEGLGTNGAKILVEILSDKWHLL